jgi:PIN domain nuclease of toxin-antitoxin system
LKLLLDTHLLIWAADGSDSLEPGARTLMADPHNELLSSVASIWEIAIMRGLDRPDFQVDARLLRHGLLHNGYHELPILSEHVVATDALLPIHKDRFDRLLIAHARVEGITLVTNDATVAQYQGAITLAS